MSAEAKNLEAIHAAVIRHNGNCGAPIVQIRMSPFEVDRLGWEDFEGIPIVPDGAIGTGRFRLVCNGDHGDDAHADSVARGVLA